jgi:AraC-like DNA-binding protein
MKEKEIISKTLYDLYSDLGLPVDLIHQDSGFTIHNLKDIPFKLPYQSPVFRPNYFSFVFVKNGSGQYTIDENLHHDIFNEFSFLLTETIQPKKMEVEAFAEMERLYLQIHKEYHENSIYKYRIIGNLFIVILLKIKEHFWTDYDPIYEGNRSSQIVKTFKQNIENHFRDLVNHKTERIFRVNDFAELQSLHPNYLSNVIKAKTGKTIMTWLSEKTIAEAKSLLQNSQMSIKEIAFLLGFTESAHFSNYFKKNTQTTPANYKKEHKKA